ncbi:N-acetyl-gamma-glutamyl-phosphate reductase [Salinisphaera sp. Q1T1-3]|uniref:N-acetyl-gamma-glutamyl-phosphate reductase n=1 Tax=Salinisphaera sp. Q1T1-3 TaxID=2321229 RepID=UPI000E7464AA|nr:N-acetyl-gamma-glutamyl-phosphate reductase [Salinisphaera sp. Q1T1-3]RJS91577.1 N-acetyl-gamma-glutamyl-phosphate reductase [Salinisphaera sp. Q1T1-3]
MARTQRIGIVGGTGYAGAELLRLLGAHPHADVSVVTSRGAAGTPVADAYPQLAGLGDRVFATPSYENLAGCDVVFFATPHAAAMYDVPDLLAAGVRVIDLSADFRLRDPGLWAQWYHTDHAAPELIERAVYGLPELTGRAPIAEAELVACPGCYPTAVLLGFKPLVAGGHVDLAHLIADAKTGVSGAGKSLKPGFLYAEMADSFKAYGVSGHRHLPEIEQVLTDMAETAVGLTFVPHLVPMIRGIHATLYARLNDRGIDLQSLFEAAYADEPFIEVLASGGTPETRHVKATNHCRIAVHRPGDRDQAVVLSTIDNLVKGAAGQAVQCFNLMIGAPETCALTQTAPIP